MEFPSNDAQLVLAFGRCKWALSRPSTRILRAIRQERARLVKLVRPAEIAWMRQIARVAPRWYQEQKKRALDLSNQVKWNLYRLELV